MGYGLKQTVGPTAEPLTPEDAKEWLKVQHGKEDELLAELVKDARERFERMAGFQLLQATWELDLDRFPGERRGLVGGVMDDERIYLPMPRLISVSSIQYVDSAGVTQTLAASKYRVDLVGEPARIEPAYGEIWPTTREVTNAVTVTYLAGYGVTAAAVPASVKVVLRKILGLLYTDRGIDRNTESLEQAIASLCRPFHHGWIF